MGDQIRTCSPHIRTAQEDDRYSLAFDVKSEAGHPAVSPRREHEGARRSEGRGGVYSAGTAPLALSLAAALSYVLACFSSCFFVFAAAVRFGGVRARLLDSLKANAFGIYLVHYLFVVWLQFALLGLELPGIIKGVIVFASTLALSWSATAALCRVPAVANIIGGDRRPAVRPVSPRAVPAE